MKEEISYSSFLDILQCPCCKEGALLSTMSKTKLLCSNPACRNKKGFMIVNGQPILIDFPESVSLPENFNDGGGELIIRKNGFAKKLSRVLWGDSPSTLTQVDLILSILNKIKEPKLLIVGGGTIGSGMQALYEHPEIDLISFDIYLSKHTHFVADAHSIPLIDESVDCVVIQAVLEHVLSPVDVVGEIHRVLKPNGIVYSETPFMQQVHEGAYDFTRFSESGHRWLFKEFDLIASGYVRGAGVSLIWAIRYFFSGLFRSKAIGTLICSLFFWLRYVERILPLQSNIDGGSCFYFFGRKLNTVLDKRSIINFYKRKR